MNLKNADVLFGRVIEEQRGAYRVQIGDKAHWATVKGQLLFAAGQRLDLPAVGDFVELDSGGERIVGIRPRSTCLVRKSAGDGSGVQVIAANVDAVLIVTSLNADFNERRMERYLMAIWESGAVPVLVLTKADVCDDPQAFLQRAAAIAAGVATVVVSTKTGVGLTELKSVIGKDKTIALVGSSGVGKSSLVNALLGQTVLAVQDIRAGDDKGRHTTTARSLWSRPDDGFVIDTPGMREFMPDVSAGAGGEALSQTFADVEALIQHCRYSDCGHRSEPGCAVQAALAEGLLPAARWTSFCKMQREQAWLLRRHDAQATAEQRKVWKKRTQEARKRRVF